MHLSIYKPPLATLALVDIYIDVFYPRCQARPQIIDRRSRDCNVICQKIETFTIAREGARVCQLLVAEIGGRVVADCISAELIRVADAVVGAY